MVMFAECVVLVSYSHWNGFITSGAKIRLFFELLVSFVNQWQTGR